MDQPLVEFRDICKVYPNGTVANDGVSFRLRTGEIHAIVGENGAGKSTVMKLLYGLERPSSGTLLIEGRPVEFRHPRDAIAQGIGLVAQQLSLVPTFTAAENIVLGREPRRGALFDRSRAVAECRALARRFGLEIDPEARVAHLSLGLRQRIEVLKTLYRGARLLLLDEPTAVLTPRECDALFCQLRHLVACGVTVAIVTHRLSEVMALADRVTVLRGGRVTGAAPIVEVDERRIAEMMIGPSAPPLARRNASPGSTAERSVPMVEVQRLSYVDPQGRARLRDVSFRIGAGEILGIAGVEGNGQNSLARILSGVEAPSAGSASLDGRCFTGRGVRHAGRLGVAAISEDRQLDGAAGGLSIAENLIATDYFRRPQSRFGLLRPAAITSRTRQMIQRFGVRASGPNARIGDLSGGNVQKVILARALADTPRLLIASQPTRGVDLGAAQFLHAELLALRERGAAILLISADLEEILALSDRVAVLFSGEITAEFAAGTADPQALGLYMTGIERQKMVPA